MRILIVDSNTVYARKVQSILAEYVTDAEIDHARDVFVARRRLTQHYYDLIIVDISSAISQEMLQEELAKHNIPTIAWTMIDPQGGLSKLVEQLGTHLLHKPCQDKELQDKLPDMIESATGSRILRRM